MTHDQLDVVLRRDELAIDPAELHGVLCAMISGQPAVTIGVWLTASLGEPVTQGYLNQDTAQLMETLFKQTTSQLDADQFEFQLLLPDDEQALSRRIEALVHWGSGYLSGLGHLGLKDFSDWPSDASEFVADLSEITKADFTGADDSPDEDSWTELVEYARVGVMLVYETLRSPDPEEVKR